MNKIQKLKLGLRSLLAEFAEITTDKGLLSYDGDELKVGDMVYTIGEDGERVTAADGDYTAEDGRIVKVADGKVAEITEKADEVVDDTTNEVVEQFRRKAAKFEETYDEKTEKIYKAISGDVQDFYIVEAGDDHVVIETYDFENGEMKLYRYAITWDEQGNAVAGDKEEVKQTFVPVAESVEVANELQNPDGTVEEDSDAIEGLRKEVNELYDIVDKLIKEVDKLKNEPAAESAVEEFKAIAKKDNTVDDHQAFIQAFASAKRK